MSDLTYEKLMETMRTIEKIAPRREPSLFDNLFRPMGMKLFEAPPPPPKIQVRNITFDDGTSILPADFRAQLNSWLIDRFGFQDDIFKDKAYILGNYGIVMSPKHIGMIRSLA